MFGGLLLDQFPLVGEKCWEWDKRKSQKPGEKPSTAHNCCSMIKAKVGKWESLLFPKAILLNYVKDDAIK